MTQRSLGLMGLGPALAGALLGCTPSGPPSPSAQLSAVAEAPRSAAAPSGAASAVPGGQASPASAAPSASAAAPASDAGAARYPLRWTASVKLKSVADIGAALGESVLPAGQSLELVSSAGNAKRSVRTCVEYGKAIADGFSPASTPDIAQASFFISRCTPLRFLSEARPSETSWLSALRLDRDPLGTLPASMNLAMERPSEGEQDAIAKGQRLKAFDPKLVITKSSPTSVTFGVPKETTSTVEIVAYGDFDHDGVEDVLLFQSHHSLEGSFRSFRHFVATRRGAKEPLMTVRELEP